MPPANVIMPRREFVHPCKQLIKSGIYENLERKWIHCRRYHTIQLLNDKGASTACLTRTNRIYFTEYTLQHLEALSSSRRHHIYDLHHGSPCAPIDVCLLCELTEELATRCHRCKDRVRSAARTTLKSRTELTLRKASNSCFELFPGLPTRNFIYST